jgi:xylose dehydrogenase (NAD/NADP)
MTDPAPLRYGILGAANIARSFTRGMKPSTLATVDAVASRGEAKAAAFAAEMGIPRYHATYEALLADPAIDAVYIPLPNDMHAEWAIKAADAGKHVLCEKPLAVTVDEARAMFAAAKANGVLLAEAYPYMSQQQTLEVRRLLAEGAVGRVQLATASFGFRLVTADGAPLVDVPNIRLDPARAGGGLLDAGTYSVSMLRILVGERPVRANASVRMTQTGVDQTIVATLEFPSGAIGQISSSMATSAHRHAVVMGDAGVIETNYSNHAPAGGGLSLRVKRGVPATIPFELCPGDPLGRCALEWGHRGGVDRHRPDDPSHRRKRPYGQLGHSRGLIGLGSASGMRSPSLCAIVSRWVWKADFNAGRR